MRALHIFDHSLPLHSGYSFRSLALLKEHRRKGIETYHITTPKHYVKGPNPEEVEGLLFHRSPPLPAWCEDKGLLDPLAQLHVTAQAVRKLSRAIKPDVIHAHSPALTSWAAYRAAKDLNIPWIYEVRAFWEDAAASHGGPGEGSIRYRLSKALESWALRRADGVTAICDGLIQDIKGRGVRDDRLQVVPNAVDIEAFKPPPYDQALASELGLEGKTILGFLGSFYDYEGLDVLIAALPMIKEKLPDVHILLVGGGPKEHELRRQAGQSGLGDCAHFIGRVPQSDVGRYYSLCDILVFPRKSIRLTELVTPLKPLETMAQKKLVLASDVGGHRELIDDETTGLLFPADDPSALAQKVVEWSTRRDEWPSILENGRTYVENERNWRVSAMGYDRLYKSLGLVE